ncbi:GNAT family N-acetyltransferase [Roseobacter sp. HKCCD9010]|uniref:GNAT family N-acetyltransferase n=1 Tax=unclassified Roseobacter TaxID=196798 RepID=UPI001491F9DC|nr:MULTISPECIES: GNAT family N-acetyltransferase [unclassified Roseobacter]MBF9048624.1 GNAT family N-acetyltransferase [Rhodobacterales bacterium HKCCD4356]NNV10623.1 GNAT family N-acetyltransferase [Roseobacter sp. HKCCD7357]NNV14808.1 GNAT family N-acetyltransferase [Roseobacter sp. HKCCD8768]NNV24267.1 GNAT family N-acetyltransferase [Roseobacter sp. HKCCD8192]NNV28524.1 GNAT family N-acetyltransferase [Roseobacter sp. HKCCD9061]
MIVRDGTIEDVEQISAFLQQLTASGKRTRPDDEAFVRANYIEDADKICCAVAEEDGVVLGFQSLKRARAGNEWGVEPGWGIIGTHIRPSAARRDAGLAHIDATIGATNPEALSYYEAMGFQTYRTPEGSVCKRFDVST